MRNQEIKKVQLERLKKAIFGQASEQQEKFQEVVKKEFAKKFECQSNDLEVIDFIGCDLNMEWGIKLGKYSYQVLTDMDGNIKAVDEGTLYE